jgi:hypothetical protein
MLDRIVSTVNRSIRDVAMDITPVNTRNGEVLNKYSWYLY